MLRRRCIVSKGLTGVEIPGWRDMNWGGSRSRSPDGGVLKAQEDTIGTDRWNGYHCPVRVEVPHVICWFVKVMRTVVIDIGDSVRTEMGAC